MTEPLPPEEPLGCLGAFQSLGLAFYAIFLLCIMCAGTTCAMGSMIVLTLIPGEQESTGLISGFEAGPLRLQGLRASGLLEPAQTPSLYFDSSAVGDGSSGCAYTNGSLLSWEQWQETGRTTVSGSSVVLADTTVTVTGQTQTVSCVFRAADANRFAVMMTTESLR